ncbi:hypothetical protein, partial [Actinomadura rubrisoli]|uniref:hypothetical protein n=1 Tax=Actinomadura rubrisoli TaxID=2530368 RepID=UPI001A9FD98F
MGERTGRPEPGCVRPPARWEREIQEHLAVVPVGDHGQHTGGVVSAMRWVFSGWGGFWQGLR